MTVCCYVRHLKESMATAGLPDDKAGRREAGRRIKVGLGLAEAHCPEVWRAVKTLDPAEVLALLRTESSAASEDESHIQN